MRIVAPYSGKHGACDYLVYRERTCIGVLHVFDFSRETYAFHHRRCNVGYAFAESLRGTGQPLEVVQYFIAFLFKSFDFLFLAAHTEFENARSIRFLEKLGFEALPPDSEDHYRFFRLYRSEESKGVVEQGRSD